MLVVGNSSGASPHSLSVTLNIVSGTTTTSSSSTTECSLSADSTLIVGTTGGGYEYTHTYN
jgi:hypothetical protein